MDCCADISYIVASHRHCCYIDIAGDTANIVRAGNRTGVITSKNFRIVLIITNDTANLLCGFISDCSGIAAVVNVAIRVRSGNTADLFRTGYRSQVAAALNTIMQTYASYDTTNLNVAVYASAEAAVRDIKAPDQRMCFPICNP